MNNYDVEIKSQGNVLLGWVGAFFGAWVGLVPFYAAFLAGYIVWFLPGLAVMSAYYGYKLFCKRDTKSMLISIPLLTALVIIAGVLLGLPVLQLLKEDFPINAYTIGLFYSVPELTRQTIFSLGMGLAGIFFYYGKIKYNIKKGAGIILPDDPMYNLTSFGTSVVLTKEIRDKFIENGAISKETALPVDELELGLKGDKLRTSTYTAMLQNRLIQMKSKKVWYDESLEKKLKLFVEQTDGGF